MPALTTAIHWTPTDNAAWEHRKMGPGVVLCSAGGTLRGTFHEAGPDTQLYLKIDIAGQMLVRVVVNDVVMCDDLVTNDVFDSFIDLGRLAARGPVTIDLICTPTGEASMEVDRTIRLCPRLSLHCLIGAGRSFDTVMGNRAGH